MKKKLAILVGLCAIGVLFLRYKQAFFPKQLSFELPYIPPLPPDASIADKRQAIMAVIENMNITIT